MRAHPTRAVLTSEDETLATDIKIVCSDVAYKYSCTVVLRRRACQTLTVLVYQVRYSSLEDVFSAAVRFLPVADINKHFVC